MSSPKPTDGATPPAMAEARAIRIYGTNDRYGDARTSPTEQPFIVSDYPDRGTTITVEFGEVPPAVRSDIAARTALADAMLHGLTGRVIGDLGDWLASYPPLPFDEYEYYVTFVLHREVDLPRSGDISPDLVAPPPPLWINPFALDRLDSEVRAAASLAFDGVAAQLSMIVGARFFRTRIQNGDWVMFRADGLSLFYPRFTTSASGSVGRGIASFPTDAIRDALDDLAQLNTIQHRWLMRPIQWYASALTMDDRWRRYQALFFAVEALTHGLAKRYRGQALTNVTNLDQRLSSQVLERLVWDEERMPLAGRFAVSAWALNPSGSADDLAVFVELKKARDRLSHGSVDDAEQLPIAEAERLVEQYLRLAVKAAVGE